ncbi:ABC-2 transporter permease [Eggerthella timonensis]|uniref:ABC-2 transporter permease n=1 Tax=Eggerthella timonensis TaxID=1871008 RepID=UPI000C775EC8|nr:ABC-2 transporter permease [Eggerthella timonensis]
MKAMIMSDLLIAKKYLVQQLGIAIVVGIFICIMIGNLYIVTPAVGVMIPFSLIIMILSLDERANWQQFRLALPISRGDVIRGRYVSFLLLALLGIAVGLLTAFLVIVAAQLMPNVPQLADLMANFSWQALLMVSVAGISIILVMLAIVMPLFSRFGMTKAVRYLPLLIIFGVWIAFTLPQNGPPPAFVLDVLNLLETPAGTVAVAAGILAIVAVAYVISAIISTGLYKKREL